ncbi:hypothetical protein DPMN_121068 [Dreissena polymorpha]|uniref:Uncharacterized protein n=1 Tax=Dreissena polymorpha TaxID=45954 RepID=A0A9D4JP50_DREPO|nr:hypothetical protein DPMN_121068 [Dreissena polymorpha]
MKVVKPLGTNPSRAPTGKFLSIVGPILQLGLDDPANAPRAHYVGLIPGKNKSGRNEPNH